VCNNGEARRGNEQVEVCWAERMPASFELLVTVCVADRMREVADLWKKMGRDPLSVGVSGTF
jgi:hypothetical protein